MNIQVALIVAATRRIAVAHVPREAFTDEALEERIKVSVGQTFKTHHVAMMMLDHNGVPTFMGTRDEVNLLADSDFTQFPWAQFHVPPE